LETCPYDFTGVGGQRVNGYKRILRVDTRLS